MGTTVDKIEYSLNAKDDITAAITEQGVEVPEEAPLGQYGDLIRAIRAGGEQSDWAETDEESDAYIKNKPTNLVHISGNQEVIKNVNIIDNNIQLIDITDKLIPTATTFATDYQYKLYKYGYFCKFYCSGSVASGGADAGTFFPLFDLPIEYAPVMVTSNGCLGGADRSFGLDTAMRVYQIEGEKVRIFANTGWWMCGQLEWIIAKEVNNGD